jgi:dTDP-4-dehydrorhamnose reductase
MLGHDVLAALDGEDVRALDRSDADLTDPGAVAKALHGLDERTVVVHCAAWTAVDDAQTREAEAFAVNAVAPQLVAAACAAAGARMLHVSTDYVFDGTATVPYPEDAPLAPRSAYGRTKAAGEWAVRAALPGRHWVVRTAWLYGAHGPSFVGTMRRFADDVAGRPSVDVVADQVGQPTWTRDLADRVVALVGAGAPAGTYHGTSSGRCSWFDLARAVFEGTGHDPQRVRPTTTAAFPRPAPRPAWSVLGHDGWAVAGLDPLPEWHDALTRFLSEG